MGNGSGPGSFSSRIYTNSYADQIRHAAIPFQIRQRGSSFAGLTPGQYSYITYNSLANLGAGAGGRAGRWEQAYGIKVAFRPPIRPIGGSY